MSWLWPRRSCTGAMARGLPLCCNWWTDTSMLGHSKGAHWLPSSLHHWDSEISAYCVAARSSSVRISRWARRSSGVTSPESPQSKAAIAAMFWLARVKCGRALSSSTILRFTSWATAHARLLSSWCSISRSSSVHSCSSWSHATSSSWCHVLSCSTHKRGGPLHPPRPHHRCRLLG